MVKRVQAAADATVLSGAQPTLTPVLVHPSTNGYHERVQQCFAATYAAGQDVWTSELVATRAMQVLLTYLSRPSRVLDIGAGRGRDSRALAALGHRVVAVDLCRTPEWRQVSNASGQLEFVQGTIRDVRPERVFAGVLDNGCFHHQHPRHALRYLRDVADRLTSEGVYVVSVFHPRGRRAATYTTSRGRLNREFAPSTLASLLRRAGLRIEHEELVSRIDGRQYRIVVAKHRSGE